MHVDSVAVCVFDRSILPLCDDIYTVNGHQVLSFGGDWWCYWHKVSRVQYFYAPTASLHILPCVPGSLNRTKSDSLKSSEKLKPTRQKYVLLQAPPTSSKQIGPAVSVKVLTHRERFHLTFVFSPAPKKDPQTSFAERISGAHSRCTWCIDEKFAGDSSRFAFFPLRMTRTEAFQDGSKLGQVHVQIWGTAVVIVNLNYSLLAKLVAVNTTIDSTGCRTIEINTTALTDLTEALSSFKNRLCLT